LAKKSKSIQGDPHSNSRLILLTFRRNDCHVDLRLICISKILKENLFLNIVIIILF